jgi:hypothetical protein
LRIATRYTRTGGEQNKSVRSTGPKLERAATEAAAPT